MEEGPEAGNRRELRRRRRRLPGKYRRTRAGLQPIGMWPDGSKARAKKQAHRVEESYEHYRRPHRGVDRMELQDDERTETKVMFPPSSPPPPPPSTPPSPPSTPLAAPACDLTLPMQVFADVDDTTHSSGGGLVDVGTKKEQAKARVAGSDPLYYPHVAYPGVAEFYLALSVGPSTDRLKLNPALLSARPEKTPLFTEKALARDTKIIEEAQSPNLASYKFYNYQERGVDGKSPSDKKWTLNFGGSKGGDLLDFVFSLGSWKTLFNAILPATKPINAIDWYHKMGVTKLNTILKFVDDIANQKFKDACVVFVGDDGQGDCEAAAGMRMREKSSGGTFAMRAAFIHKLKTSDAKLNCKAKSYDEEGWSGGLRLETPAEEDGELEGPTYLPPIIYFDTYLDAAHAAFRMGLIQQQGLRDVYTAVTKFESVRATRTARHPLRSCAVDPSGCARVRGMPLARPSTAVSTLASSFSGTGNLQGQRFTRK